MCLWRLASPNLQYGQADVRTNGTILGHGQSAGECFLTLGKVQFFSSSQSLRLIRCGPPTL